MASGSQSHLLADFGQRLRAAARAGAALAAFTLTGSCGGNTTQGGNSQGGMPASGGAPASGGVPLTGGVPESGGSSALGGNAGQGGLLDGSGGLVVSTGGSAGESGNPPPLEPYPLDGIGCFGEVFNGGYSGQCCVSAQCYEPKAGAGCIAAEPSRLEALLAEFPPGSGSCNCESPGHPQVAGPYAQNPDGKALSPGTCCYLVGAIECEGRPLVVDGALVVARVVERADWSLLFV